MSKVTPDLFTHLSQSEKFDFDGPTEAQLAIVAGADTNAITLSNVCWYLCSYPEYQKRLYGELEDLPIVDGLIEDQYLIDKPYLSGIVTEVLRLHPPVPGGVQRLTPPEGATIAGRYIPGNINVSTPTYSVQRGTLSRG